MTSMLKGGIVGIVLLLMSTSIVVIDVNQYSMLPV